MLQQLASVKTEASPQLQAKPNPHDPEIRGSPENKCSWPSSLTIEVVKTFYIETFGCQMNAHDSEKVVGTLVGQGYQQVETPEAAELVFYNTCSIRDKAEQKVFHRLQQFKREHGKAKTSAALASAPPHAAHKT